MEEKDPSLLRARKKIEGSIHGVHKMRCLLKAQLYYLVRDIIPLLNLHPRSRKKPK
jgi:hypothetical protein